MKTHNFTGEGYTALRHTVGGAIPNWDDNAETHDNEYSPAIATIIMSLQKLFIERISEWTHFMAHAGWQRQRRWNAKEWMRLIFNLLRHHTHHPPGTEVEGLEGIASTQPLRDWVDSERDIVQRILHGMQCLRLYMIRIAQPALRETVAKEEKARIRRHARWKIYAYIVRVYKQNKQQQILQSRAAHRVGLVSANTRNVGRLAPKQGVIYNHTKQYKPRIPETTLYKLRRWPHRDKCGPTLALLLYYVWGIT